MFIIHSFTGCGWGLDVKVAFTCCHSIPCINGDKIATNCHRVCFYMLEWLRSQPASDLFSHGVPVLNQKCLCHYLKHAALKMLPEQVVRAWPQWRWTNTHTHTHTHKLYTHTCIWMYTLLSITHWEKQSHRCKNWPPDRESSKQMGRSITTG